MRHYRVCALCLALTCLLSACAFGTNPTDAPTTTTTMLAPTTAGSADPTPVSADPQDASAGTSGKRVTITFALWENERAIYEPLITAFERQNLGIHVQLVPLDPLFRTGEPADPQKAILSAADTTTEPPTPEAISNGWVRDLAPLIDADAAFDRTDLYSGALDAVSQDGHTYMLPRTFNVPLMFYNKDLWARHGLPAPKWDWTWADALAAAEQLAQKQGNSVEVYGMVDVLAQTALREALAAKGVTSGQQPWRYDDPKVIAAVERVVALIQSGAILSFDSLGANFGPGEPQFADLIRKERLGMWSPDLGGFANLSTPPAFAIGSVPLPKPAVSYFTAVEGYTLSSGSQHPQEAWRWLAFLSHQASLKPTERSLWTNAVPARKLVAEQSGFWQQLDSENAAALKNVLGSASLQRIGAAPPPFLNPSLDYDLIQAAWHDAISGTKTVAQALHDAQRELDQHPLPASTPTPDTSPIAVATPKPEATHNVVRITFGAPSLAIDQTRRLADTFNASNRGVFVDVTEVSPPRNYVTADAAALPLAEVAAMTDCFTTFDLPDQTTFTATLDLQSLIAADAGGISLDDYPPALLAPYRYGTELHGLPYQVFFRMLNYNVTAFDAAGIAPPSAAWTLDDLLHAAQQLTHGAGQAKQYGYAAPGGQTRDVFFVLDHVGVSPVTGSADVPQPNFTDPRVVQVIHTYLDLLRTSSPHRRLQGYTRNDSSNDGYQAIVNSQVGMWLDYGRTFIDPNTAPGRQSVNAAVARLPVDMSLGLISAFIRPDRRSLRGLLLSTANKDVAQTRR
jgi:ABC-type glycerol-3-phosphate transport system substrate-binding protein